MPKSHISTQRTDEPNASCSQGPILLDTCFQISNQGLPGAYRALQG
jgi:hypothetical protein